MIDLQNPALAIEGTNWQTHCYHLHQSARPQTARNKNITSRFQRFRLVKFIRFVFLLRYLFSRQQHLILRKVHELFGDRIRFALGPFRFVILSDPHSIQTVLDQGPETMSAGAIRNRLAGVFPAQSVFYAEGEKHKTMRKIVAQAFGKATQEIDLNQHFDDLMIETQAIDDDTDRSNAIQDCLLRIAGHLVFGSTNDEIDALARRLLHDLDHLHTAAFLFPWLRILPWVGNGTKRFRITQQLLKETIDVAMIDGTFEAGLLKHLIPASKGKLSTCEIRDNAAFIFLVIIRTLMPLFRNVAHALAVETRWQQELRVSKSTDDGLFRAVVKETLRLAPPTPVFGRLARRDINIDGFQIRKSEWVLIAPWITHFRHESFPNPTQFDPTRFLRASQKNLRHRFLPYGGGTNHCLGAG